MKKLLAMALAVLMVLTQVPLAALAANDYAINSSESSDDYYNLISKTDWDIAPGITESQIVLNNDDGSRRQVLFVMEADLNNEYVKVINSYNGMVPEYGSYKTGVMSEQAAYAEANGYGNVVGAMNTTLSWYSGYPADRVGEPLGFIMLDAEVLFDPANCGYEYGNVGFPSVVVINKDFDDEGNPRPADIPKVEMPQIRSAADLDGWEDQVIPCSSGYIVKDGKNVNSPNHSDAAPRSVVGIKPDGTVVIMVNDGRQSPYSAGMSMYELAEVMLDLGCTYAVNCDGGGSTTWVSQRPGEELKVNNSPSDGAERPTTTGILFISTAPADGQFARANISTDSKYYTPYSSVTFNVIGTDLVGNIAEIPAEVTWQIKEDGMGTIENGVFVSNGTRGTVTAQMVYNGNVVGEASIEIVVPTEFSFSQSVMTVPFGKTVTIGIKATINGGLNDVTLKDSDVVFTTTNSALGTFNGYEFTSVSEENAPANLKSIVTATFQYAEGLVATAQLNLGKASEVLFDFEDGLQGWQVGDVNQTADYSNIYNTSLTHVTTTNGKVHDGNGALKFYMNGLDQPNPGGSYKQFALYPEENVIIENAKAIGVWVYIPDEMYSLWVRIHYWVDANGDGVYETKNTIGSGLVDAPFVYKSMDESGWYYICVDISAYSSIMLKAGTGKYSDAKDARFLELNAKHCGTDSLFQDLGTINGAYTFYIDSITADYSDAVEDREAPIFNSVNLMGENESVTPMENNVLYTSTSNLLSVMAQVVENTKKTNATGLNAASAKAYIDGVAVDCTYANGRISINNVAVADGVHRVKFEICDNAGNKSVVVRVIKVESGVDASGIVVVPANPNLDRLLGGSLYWLNINATNIETIQSITTQIDLNSSNHWELDHMVLAAGFTATYSIDEETNTATITITRTGVNNERGAVTLAALPIRVIYYDTDIHLDGYTAESYWQTYDFWPHNVRIDVDMGQITYVDGYTSPVLNAFSSEEYSIATEFYIYAVNMDAAYRAEKGTCHVHNAVTLDAQEATCTEVGYTNRTFCEACNSVVDWGTVVPAKGHSYDFNAEGLLACEGCGELFNGEHTDGKTYVDGVIIADGWYQDTYYYIDGVKVTGQYAIDGTMYNFDENGVYMPNYSFTGFYHDGTGWMYFLGNFQKKGFVVIDGNTHYFDDITGYAPVGSFTLGNGRVYKVEGEQGKVLGAWETVTVDGVERRRYYYSLRYYKNQWLEVEGETYYFNNDGYALIGKRAVARSGEYLGGYEFAMDGKLVGAIDGPFTDYENGYMYIAEDGVLACNKLVEHNGDYYFARSNHLLLTWGAYLTEEQTGGLLPAGEYQFGADGKLIMQNGPVADAYNSAYLTFYVNGVRVYEEGLYQYKGDYYYVRSNGLLITWPTYISEEKANGLLPAGEYQFGADGKLIMQNGPVADVYNPAYLTFYKDGVRIYKEGLYEYNGGYYYVRANGLLITWPTYVSKEKANGLLPAGEYTFGADGKLVMQSGPAADVYNPNYLVFYIDGIRITKEGLYEHDGDYYYVRSNGLLQTWATYVSEDKTNGLLPAGYYSFGADGKLIMRNGVCLDDFGKLCYYIDGVQQYDTGLIYWEGNYYYVRPNGLICTWAIYVSESKANGLLPAGEYTFGEDGKMIENP